MTKFLNFFKKKQSVIDSSITQSFGDFYSVELVFSESQFFFYYYLPEIYLFTSIFIILLSAISINIKFRKSYAIVTTEKEGSDSSINYFFVNPCLINYLSSLSCFLSLFIFF